MARMSDTRGKCTYRILELGLSVCAELLAGSLSLVQVGVCAAGSVGVIYKTV